jgi:hypothetical protein
MTTATTARPMLGPAALALLSGLALAVFATLAHAAVPTADDFAACNMKAAEKADDTGGAASPGGDRQGPAPRPKMPGPTAGVTKDPSGKTVTDEHDPQIEGMAADRMHDPGYVQAYRACMRQRGF